MSATAKSGLVPIQTGPPAGITFDVFIDDIRPAPENDLVYRRFDATQADDFQLVASIRDHGVLEPIKITMDRFILSGHRRYAAARLAKLNSVPCQYEDVRRDDDPEGFVRLLTLYNAQRVKSRDEQLREAVVQADPDEAHQALLDHRRQQRRKINNTITLGEHRKRAKITKAKKPFLDAVLKILDSVREFWPVSERSIHYQLLNDPPLRHASKPDSTYINDKTSPKSLSDLCTRARLDGSIPFDALTDETRPVTVWRSHAAVGGFIEGELNGMLKGYSRDLLQSQPDHIEICTEKLTLRSLIDQVAADYTVSTCIGRGFASLPPRYEMFKRYEASGKDRLVVLLLADFDPDGECIAESFARSMRDDFKIKNIVPVKVALTEAQIKKYRLPKKLKAKKTSSRTAKFVKKYGNDDVWELEALPLAELQKLLRAAIDNVIDVKAFNAELDAEKRDAQFLAGARTTVRSVLAGIDFGQENGGRA